MCRTLQPLSTLSTERRIDSKRLTQEETAKIIENCFLKVRGETHSPFSTGLRIDLSKSFGVALPNSTGNFLSFALDHTCGHRKHGACSSKESNVTCRSPQTATDTAISSHRPPYPKSRPDPGATTNSFSLNGSGVYPDGTPSQDGRSVDASRLPDNHLYQMSSDGGNHPNGGLPNATSPHGQYWWYPSVGTGNVQSDDQHPPGPSQSYNTREHQGFQTSSYDESQMLSKITNYIENAAMAIMNNRQMRLTPDGREMRQGNDLGAVAVVGVPSTSAKNSTMLHHHPTVDAQTQTDDRYNNRGTIGGPNVYPVDHLPMHHHNRRHGQQQIPLYQAMSFPPPQKQSQHIPHGGTGMRDGAQPPMSGSSPVIHYGSHLHHGSIHAAPVRVVPTGWRGVRADSQQNIGGIRSPRHRATGGNYHTQIGPPTMMNMASLGPSRGSHSKSQPYAVPSSSSTMSDQSSSVSEETNNTNQDAVVSDSTASSPDNEQSIVSPPRKRRRSPHREHGPSSNDVSYMMNRPPKVVSSSSDSSGSRSTDEPITSLSSLKRATGPMDEAGEAGTGLLIDGGSGHRTSITKSHGGSSSSAASIEATSLDNLTSTEASGGTSSGAFDSSIPSNSGGSVKSGRGKDLCNYPSCRRLARARGLCKTHGGGTLCSLKGCGRQSQGNHLCIKHGGGRRCEVLMCTRAAQSNHRCKAHGGGQRCTFDGCNRSSQGGGYCRSHGGGQRCKISGCDKGAQRDGYCAAHGGIRMCTVEGCTKNDRGGGLCAEHGGGKRCLLPHCTRPSRKQGMCAHHFRRMSEISAEADKTHQEQE